MRDSPHTTLSMSAPDALSRLQSNPGKTLTRALQSASDATGIAFTYLLAQASQESGLNPRAENPRSSASGLFQFTHATWLDIIHRHGAGAGLRQFADAIVQSGHGELSIPDPAMRQKIMALRHDPAISARMAAEYAKDNKRFLEAHLGRPASGHDLYLAHFLGPSGAVKILERKDHSPKRSATALLPGAALANPAIFQDPHSHKPRSVAALYKAVQAHYNLALDKATRMTRVAVATRVTGLSSTPHAHPPPLTPPLAPSPAPSSPAIAIAALDLGPASPPRPQNPFYPVEIPPDPGAPPSTAQADKG